MTGSGAGVAPPEEMVYYLAVFARAFDAIAAYGTAGDRDGILLGGDLADALHNVPGMLRDCSPRAWHTPAHMRGWVGSTFPSAAAERGLPPRLREHVAAIVNSEGAAQILGLSADLSDYDPAPPAVRDAHLSQLYHACLSLRLVRGYHHRSRTEWLRTVFRRHPGPNPLGSMLWAATAPFHDDLRRAGLRSAALADRLWPVPFALVRWSTFDSDAYRLDLRVRSGSLGAAGHQSRDPLHDFAVDPRNWVGH